MTLFIPILPQMKKYFNSHAHVERDSIPPFQTEREGYFNSHAHVERDDNRYSVLDYNAHFNSHAHVERDLIFYSEYTIKKISTHTLTWSVTYY